MLDGGVDGCLSAGDLLEGPVDLFGAGVLGQIAASARPEGVDDRSVVCVGGQHEHIDVGVVFAEAARGLDAVAARHAQVHQHHVRA